MIIEHLRPFHTSWMNTIRRICKDFPGSSYLSGRLERRTPSVPLSFCGMAECIAVSIQVRANFEIEGAILDAWFDRYSERWHKSRILGAHAVPEIVVRPCLSCPSC